MSVPTSCSWARCDEPPKTGSFNASFTSSSEAPALPRPCAPRCDISPALYTYSLSGAVTCPWASMIIQRGLYRTPKEYTGFQMLDQAKNQLLTQVGSETPMGQ